jgi:hypothetical protein
MKQAFSKVKGSVRRAEARTREALIEAMGRALSAMDARAFFAHCGYREVKECNDRKSSRIRRPTIGQRAEGA